MKYAEKDLRRIAQRVLAEVGRKGTNILALNGDLGAGKTTLVGAIAKELGVVESVTSPTFIIYRVYDTPKKYGAKLSTFLKLVHIDAYRLEGERDAKKVRLHELFEDPENLVCIEWPEHAGDVLPKNALHLYLTYTGEHERGIEIR